MTLSLRQLTAPVAFFVVAVLVGATTTNQYVLQQGTILWCYALAVVGLGFAVHVSGEFLLAQGAIFTLSGYAAAITTTSGGKPYGMGLLVGMVFGALLGLVLGVGALRTFGWYFAMASFFLAAIVPDIIDLFPSKTGGDNGLFGLPLAGFGSGLSPQQLYFMALAFVAVCAALIGVLRQSRAGLAMAVMRERPAAAASLGFSPVRLRLLVFVVCSVPAGLGGAIYAHLYGFIQPTMFPLSQTILFFSAVVIGGRRMTGVLVGLTVLFWIPLKTLGAGANSDILYSAVIIVLAIFLAQRERLWRPIARWVSSQDALRSVRPVLAWLGVRQVVDPETVEVSPEGARSAAQLLQSLGSRERPDQIVAGAIQVRFGSLRAVNFGSDDSLKVRAGEVHALLGANGSGKTTLLNALSGHVASSGSITMGERDLVGTRAAARARWGLGRSWQSPALPQEATPVQLVRLGLSAPTHAVHPSEHQGSLTASRALELAGLGAHADEPVSSLSSAQRRWLDLIVAVSRPVDFVILDEPGAGLTRAGRSALAELVRTLADAGVGVVLIEHDLDLALRVADYVTVLDAGAPIYQGPPSGVRGDARVRTLFLGQVDPSAKDGRDLDANDREVSAT